MMFALLCWALADRALAARAPDPQAGTVTLESASIKDENGNKVQFELGTLYVPENRAVAGSRVIGVGFARLRAKGPTTAPPIFVLPGGPGWSELLAFTSRDEDAQDSLDLYLELAGIADVVVVDQRGYSTRGEILTLSVPPAPLGTQLSLPDQTRREIETANRASAAHPDKDLAGYTVVELAHDVNDLRAALGYDRITLQGGSFGSQWSFAVMRLHPEIVARAMLCGVEPLDFAYDMPSHVVAALQRIARDADRDPALAPYLPPGGLMEAVQTVHDRFAAGPIEVTVTDEKGKNPQKVVLGLGDFQSSLVTRARGWPAFVLSLYHEHYDEWARELVSDAEPTDLPLIGQLIDSSLGVTPDREYQLRTDPATALVGTWGFEPYIAAASTWPTEDVGDALRRPVQNDIPVLFVHGDWDTSTPIENTLSVLPFFSSGRALLVHHGMHGACYALTNGQPESDAGGLPEIREAFTAFLRTGDMSGIPVEATLPLPAFRVPSFPPPPRR